jgi:periplasmic divalent cation tolerance protein
MTAGSQQEAGRIAEALVGEGLAACVNVIPGITSVYRWQDEIQRDQEWLLIAKTRRRLLDDLVERVQALHSYEVPEVIALPLDSGSEPYLRWLDGEVRQGHGAST